MTKAQQFEIIKKNNPAPSDCLTWIRAVNECLTFAEALGDSDYEGWEVDGFAPDYDASDALKIISTGIVTVYSSTPIGLGTFATPSEMEARSYAGPSAPIYCATLSVDALAWIDPMQGQFTDLTAAELFTI